MCFVQLNRRERTSNELVRHLERKGVGVETATACLRQLTEQGYVDDARYARLFVHDKRELDGWGIERIRRALTERGLDRDLIETALEHDAAERGPEETELARALALLERRFPAPPADRRERERALGMLVRRGFASELALDALSAYSRSG